MTVQTRIQLWVPEPQIAHFTIWLEIKSRILLENLPLYNIFDQLELQVIMSSFKEGGILLCCCPLSIGQLVSPPTVSV